MSDNPLDEPWNWTVLTLECPSCHVAVPQSAAHGHAAWHWLTQTETRRVQ